MKRVKKREAKEYHRKKEEYRKIEKVYFWPHRMPVVVIAEFI
jgi:hypothetical protein